MKFKSKTDGAIVDAELYDGSLESAQRAMKSVSLPGFSWSPNTRSLESFTTSGIFLANPNEWIVKTPSGSLFSCKIEEFSKSYIKIV